MTSLLSNEQKTFCPEILLPCWLAMHIWGCIRVVKVRYYTSSSCVENKSKLQSSKSFLKSYLNMTMFEIVPLLSWRCVGLKGTVIIYFFCICLHVRYAAPASWTDYVGLKYWWQLTENVTSIFSVLPHNCFLFHPEFPGLTIKDPLTLQMNSLLIQLFWVFLCVQMSFDLY